MKKVVFAASHLGYPLEKTPLGGGAAVAERLARLWAPQAGRRGSAAEPFELFVLGSGPMAPARGDYQYIQLPESAAQRDLVKLSELGYARFCREFESATTRWILGSSPQLPPQSTCVIVNDVSEGPDLSLLTRAGYKIVSLWHVDVVDFFGKIYFKSLFSPEKLVGFYEFLRNKKAAWAVPSVLRLVFEKQRQTVAQSSRLIFPSKAMADVVARCYGGVAAASGEVEKRSLVVGWGSWDDDSDKDRIVEMGKLLRSRFRIGPETAALITLSRISPEKGIDLLLKALIDLERGGFADGKDLVLFVCGEAAFMKGKATFRRLKSLARRLKKVRIFFTGHLDPSSKRAYLGLCDLFVSPSIHESYGLTIVEAMRAGLPVLALDHYGVRETLESGCGRIVSPPSLRQAPRALALALEELLPDRENLRAMGKRAREAVLKKPFGLAARQVLDAALSVCSAELQEII